MIVEVAESDTGSFVGLEIAEVGWFGGAAVGEVLDFAREMCCSVEKLEAQ